MNIFKRNKGQKTIYSSIETIDYYDGAMTGIFKLDGHEQWYIFNLSFFDPSKNQRFFSLIETSEDWATELKAIIKSYDSGMVTNYADIRKIIKDAFMKYKGDVFLMKAQAMEDIDYEIVKIPLTYLNYYDSIEDAFNQDEKLVQQLKSFFMYKE